MKTKFVFLLLPEVHLMDLAGADQAILESIDYGAGFEIEYCNLKNGIVSTTGLPIGNVKHYTGTEMRKGDYLFIPGCRASYLQSPDFKKETQLFAWLRNIHQKTG